MCCIESATVTTQRSCYFVLFLGGDGYLSSVVRLTRLRFCSQCNPVCLILLLVSTDEEAASADGTPMVDVTIADCGIV